MEMHQQDNRRPFRNRPQHRPEGTGKGKPQNYYPWVFKVVADAVCLRPKGTVGAWIFDRKQRLTKEEFKHQMETALPGCWSWMEENLKPCSTDRVELLLNRVYKMYYSGTSARGNNHDPSTRAVESSEEHWRRHIPPSNPLWGIHEAIVRSQITEVQLWKGLL